MRQIEGKSYVWMEFALLAKLIRSKKSKEINCEIIFLYM
ncbi:hypothetical protein COXBURSA331_A0100 [Coxiella burnetii RSA 331]|nr:hypothetical protein COXBURSA331_A0100 [Coxiella burnetii RSA 331]EDR36146.1 hypothetical protein COXBURSA334_0107 [Coxiella burnetii Q321]